MSLRKLIGVLNLSSKISNTDVKSMIIAVQEQLKFDVAPAYEKDYWFIIFYADQKSMSPRAYPIVIVDNDSTPGALGFHSEQNGQPYGKIMVDPILQAGGVALYDANNPQNYTVSATFSHEVIETFVDPYVNVWVDGPQISQGSCYAMEAGDPVENNSYKNTAAGVPVSVSNFVLPAYFDSQGKNEKFDYLGVLTAPFTLASGGYMVVRNAPGTEQQVFGDVPPPQWKLDMKKHKLGSRSQTRMSSDQKKKWWKYFI